jgi:predicted transcriptional regulator
MGVDAVLIDLFTQSMALSDPYVLNAIERLQESSPRMTQMAIAEQCGLSTRTIRRSLKRLMAKGVIERRGRGAGGSYEYTIVIPR